MPFFHAYLIFIINRKINKNTTKLIKIQFYESKESNLAQQLLNLYLYLLHFVNHIANFK